MSVRANREQFLDVLSHYYKTERDRAEKCMTDLISILSNETNTSDDQINEILDRLVAHYSRAA